MPTTPRLPLILLALASASLASGCASKAPTLQRYPSAALVIRETEPVLTLDHVARGDAGLNDFEAEHTGWGKRGWDRVDVLCRWFADNGATFRCPAKPSGPP